MHRDLPVASTGPVKGTVSDRPWGVTLGALGLDGRTGQLTLTDDGRSYRIVFMRGAIVGATSPLAVDSPLRVALTNRMITATQAAELKLKLRVIPERDEIDVIAETVKFPVDQADRLRDLVLVRCAARTFAIDHGHYVLEDRIGEVSIEGHVDVRAVIYFGVRMNLSQQRLAYDLRQLGSWFVLKPKTVDDLSGFGFGDDEWPILEALRGGTNLADFEARHRDVDPRTAQAVIYALAACDAVVCCEPPAMMTTSVATPTPSAPQMTRVPTPRDPVMTRVPTPRDPVMTRVPTPRLPTMSNADTSPWGQPTVSSQGREPRPRARGSDGIPAIRGASDSGFVDMRPTTVRPNALAAHEVEALIATRLVLLDHGVDHFTMLGLPRGAPAADVHAAYVELARYLEPKQLAALGIRDDHHAARRLFAQVCIAVTVLTDPSRRDAYVQSLRR